MSYLVLARKYRPRSFAEMVGQEHVVRALGNALQSQRLHHAYLFTGTRGVGKTTVSRILAKSLNCLGTDGQGGITAEPCGVCQACTDIDAGRFVDYTELDAASNRGVDEVQSLLEQAVYKPVQGRFKVFMIDEVHMLSNTAFNAMLKTLEEPPEYLKFVLATTDPQKVPVTVLSRCLQFNLRPMAPQTVLDHLTHVLANEQIAAESQALRLLARAARGSMRDALSLTDQAIAFGAGQLQLDAVRQMLGSVDRSHVFRLIGALAAADGKTVVETVQALRLAGLSAASTLEEMTLVLQRMAVLQAVPDAGDDSDPDAQTLAQLASDLPADETQLLYSMCLHGREELGLAPDEYAALTMVLLRLLAFKPGAISAGAAGATAEKKTLKSAEPPPAAPQSPAAPMPAAEQAVALTATTTATASLGATADRTGGSLPAPAPIAAVHTTANAPVQSACAAFSSEPEESAVADRPAPLAPASVVARPGHAMPAGQVLPVVVHPKAAVAQEVSSTPPPAVLAVPVRTAPESRVDVPTPGAVGTPLVPTEEGTFWHLTVQQLVASEAVNALVRELALQSQLVGRDGEHWLLRVERESLNSGTSRERLQAALQAAGHAVTLGVEIGRVTDSPAKRNAAAAAERQLAAEKLIFEDPFVQSMMRDFGAKIVPGSIKPLDPSISS